MNANQQCRAPFRGAPVRGLATTVATLGVVSAWTGVTQVHSAQPNTPTRPVSATMTTPLLIPAAATKPVATTMADCATRGWGTGPKTLAPMTLDEVYNVRAGRHSCFDRVVFDVNGPVRVGYTIRYVPAVLSDGAGTPIKVAGGAALAVGVHAPDFGAASGGHQPAHKPWTSGQTLINTPGWHGLRQVRFAGGFEGYSQYAVGTRARLPFRVTTWTSSGYTHIIVDIAHG